MIIATPEESLRRLALHDEGWIQCVLGIHLNHDEAAGLDPKTQALVRLGGLVAWREPVPTIGRPSRPGAGATTDDIVGTLVAVAPISGLARVVSATPEVALALGYDIDQAFEELDQDSSRGHQAG